MNKPFVIHEIASAAPVSVIMWSFFEIVDWQIVYTTVGVISVVGGATSHTYCTVACVLNFLRWLAVCTASSRPKII